MTRMFETHPNKIHEFSNNKICDYCKLTKEAWDELQRLKQDLFS
jgi:glutaredoxin